jgi:hypothetical protein
MKVSLDVADRTQAAALKTAMEDETARVLVLVSGLLLRLPTHAQRRRVLAYCLDYAEDRSVRVGPGALRLHDATDSPRDTGE